MSKKLYVGNLSYQMDDQSLRDTFAKAGNVLSANVIMNKETGRSKGFGFVEMESDADADTAIEMYNGKELDGRKVVVNEARPLEPRPPRQNFNRSRNSY